MILSADYDFQIRDEIKTVLSGKDQNKLKRAEKAALEQMRSYLSQRFDTQKLIWAFEDFNQARHYTPGMYCLFNDQLFCCKYECLGIEPSEDDFWFPDDPRNAMLVMYLIDMTLYHLYAAQTLKAISEHRSQRYQDALDWLKDARDGKIETGLPAKVDPKNLDFDFRFGSNPKRNNRY